MKTIESGKLDLVKWAQRQLGEARRAHGDASREVSEAAQDLDAAWTIYGQPEIRDAS